MSNKILIKRGSGAPTTSDLDNYEIAYDTGANKLYIRDGSDIIPFGAIVDEDNFASDDANRVPSQQSVKAYIAAELAAAGAGDITAVVAGTGLSGGADSGSATLNIDSTVATLTGTQTLTNKTLASPTFTGDIDFSDSSTPQLNITDTTNTVTTRIQSQDSSGTVGTTTAHNFGINRNSVSHFLLFGQYTMHNSGGNDIDFRAKDSSGNVVFQVDAGTSKTEISTLLLDSVSISAIQSSGESFADNDTSLMTSAAINDRIESFGYITTDTNTEYSAGTGLDLSGTTFSVDVSDFMSDGADNRVLTATGTDGFKAESNLTFGGTNLSIAAGGKLQVDEVEGKSNNTNTLLLNDDQTLANNMVSLQSINHINIMTDGNNNGTGDFRVWNGSYDVDTADLAFAVNSVGNSIVYGNLTINGTISGNAIKDEDNMSSNSASHAATQQSIKAYVDAEVAGIVNSAPAALNTLDELAAALGDDANFATTTSTALGNRLRVDTASQGLTSTQQANAITNLGITATKAELNYVDGVTSNIQTQLNGKLSTSGTAANSTLLNNLGAGSFLRSDTADTATGLLTLNGGVHILSGTGGGKLRIKRNSGSSEGDDIVDLHMDDNTLYFDMDNDGDGDAGTFTFRYKSGGSMVTTLQSTNSTITYKGNTIWHAGNDGTGSGLDADLLDGYHLSTTRDSANTVPVRDGNGYLNLGWINTTSGNTTTASSDYYVNTNDGYIRKKTLANVRTEIMGVSSGSSFLRSDATDTASSKITFSSGLQDNTTHIGYTGGHGLEGANLTAQNWADFPVGFRGMMRSGQGSTYGSPTTNYGYFLKFANRDSGGGWGGIWIDYNNTTNAYIGTTTVNTSYASWGKIWTDTNDGHTSGLDADLLDGVEATNFARKGNTAENTASNRLTINSNNAMATGTGHQAGLEVYNSSAGNDAFMQFHVSNDFALYFGLDGSTNDLAVGGWSMGANKYKIWHAGNTSSFTGDLVSSERDKGVFGTYDSTKTDHIWSMGTAYRNSSTGADFGNLYGLAYKHVNNTTGGNMGGGHQMVWVTNGTPRASLGEVSIWSKNYFHAAGNYGGSWDTNNNTALTFTASSSGTAYNVLRCDTDNGFKLQTLGGTGGVQRWYTSGSNYIQFTGTTITASLSGTASNASLLDNLDSSQFLRSDANDTFSGTLTGSRIDLGYAHGNANSIGCSNWFRSSGATGWYSGTYGGGIRMTDTTWVRVYNGKAFYVANQIAATGDVTAYYSDERLKTKIETIDNAVDKVMSLEGFIYEENELAEKLGYTNKGKRQAGISAQQVKKVLPEAVTLAAVDMETDELSGEITSKSGENYLTVKYEKIVPLLIEAIKEQQQQIKQLEEKLNG